jgi:ribonuclease HI
MSAVTAKAICDGRGNGGAGARACVLTVDGQPIEKAERLGPVTNMVAEHMAIQLAMEMAKAAGVTDLLILNDSRVPVNQVNGTYKVNKPHLKPLVAQTLQLRAEFASVEVRWTPRANTLRADALCRAVDPALDRGEAS